MATALKPGVGRALFARVAAEGKARGRLALTPLALAIERQAKINANGGSHKRGTPTPARPGSGPAIISGTGRRAITHTPVVRFPYGWLCRVGMGVGFYPPYGKTPANEYMSYLERAQTRNGTAYPFLEPAFLFGVRFVAPHLYHDAYGKGWTRLI
jgi:hypothetical protein